MYMKTLKEYLPFVKEQIQIQEKLAQKYPFPQWRTNLHLDSAATFRELAETIEKAEVYIEELEKKPSTPITPKNLALELSYDEIEGLPEELIKELSISDTDKEEYLIKTIISEAGGVLNLDRILIGLFKQTNEVHKRTAINSRLYRMVQKGSIYPVPSKKGVYSVDLSEDHGKKD